MGGAMAGRFKVKWYDKVETNIEKIESDTSPFDFHSINQPSYLEGLVSSLLTKRWVHAFFRRFMPVKKFLGMYWVFRYEHVRQIRDNSERQFEQLDAHGKDLGVFETPYGKEMKALLGGDVEAALGMRNTEKYQFYLNLMKKILRPEDLPRISENAAKISESLIDYASGEIDAVRDLQTRVSVETCADYFGLTINHPDEFALWMMSMSAVLFSDPYGDEKTWRRALKGARNVTAVIDAAYHRMDSIAGEIEDINEATTPIPVEKLKYSDKERDNLPNTLMGRLVLLQRASASGSPELEEIRSMIVVLATGWVPTGAAAGGNILEYLLNNKKALKQAQKQASSGDDRELGKCLLEAMRFSPPINPGLPRHTLEETHLEVKRRFGFGTKKIVIPKGATVMAASASAMFDGRNKDIVKPNKYDPERQGDKFSKKVDLQFGGYGILHYCIGEQIAQIMLTQTFKPLLEQRNLKRVAGAEGKLQSVGAFPQHLKVQFEPKISRYKNSIVTVCIPMPSDPEPERIARVNRALDSFGNPCGGDLKDALDRTGIIHYAHISAIPGTPKEAWRKSHSDYLFLELSIDGDVNKGIEKFVDEAFEWLNEVLRFADIIDNDRDEERVKKVLKRHVKRISAFPYQYTGSQASGLEFYGTPELTVRGIDRDREIVAEARKHLDDYLKPNAYKDPSGSAVLSYVRNALKLDPKIRHDLVRPKNRILAINRQSEREFSELTYLLLQDRIVLGCLAIMLWSAVLLGLVPFLGGDNGEAIRSDFGRTSLIVSSIAGFAIAYLFATYLAIKTKSLPGKKQDRVFTFFRTHKFAIFLTFVGISALIFCLVKFTYGLEKWSTLNYFQSVLLFFGTVVKIFGGIFVGLALVAIAVVLVATVLVILLRQSERADPGRDIDPDLDHVQSVTELENPAGCVQNHIVAVTELKTDPRWLRRFTLSFSFFWVEKLITYLYRPGLIIDMGTIHFARWFRLPGTDKLVFTSNYDGSWESYLEDFITKAQWGQTAVWGNGVGFPEVEWLFYKGAGDGARFKRWVRRQQLRTRFWYTRFPELSTDQMRNNALICEGLAKASSDSEARAWVDLFGSRPRPADSLERSEIQTLIFKGLAKYPAAEMFPVRIPTDDNYTWTTWLGKLSSESPEDEWTSVSFGDNPTKKVVMSIAFSSEGLERMGLGKMQHTKQGDVSSTLESFPEAFVRGMANDERARILGDFGESHPSNWKWHSTCEEDEPEWKVADKPAHAIVIMYGEERTLLSEHVRKEKKFLKDRYELDVGPSIVLQDAPKKAEYVKEPFGFRDGISQPIIEGTEKAGSHVDPMHIVKPGEFILGYPDNSGHFPHSPAVLQSPEQIGILAEQPKNLPGRFPEFDNNENIRLRDFGRNGSFLVFRQLKQHTEELWDYLDDKAASIRTTYVNSNVTAAWLAAKMVGRWQGGASLLANPYEEKKDSDIDADNDFLFGKEDPQGLRCPYGSHIRRANPRDSLSPNSEYQLMISNRHRLLRRGRSYVSSPEKATYQGDWPEGSDTADGLLFMCLNADIERQFEFVQQTWMSDRIFHGLEDERDPIVSSRVESDAHGNDAVRSGSFTIPTTFGQIKLDDLPTIITVLNGGYFFMPSRSALRFLSKTSRKIGKISPDTH